jgi:mono/diheme cytochrome c family protein
MTSARIPDASTPLARRRSGHSARRFLHQRLRTALLCLVIGGVIACGNNDPAAAPTSSDDEVAQGKQIFRFDTFGDETKWTDTLRMHEVIATVDNSFAQGVGKRLDGWPNGDLDVGAIVALSPVLDDATKAVFNSWGPGKYDPRFNLDGQNAPAVIPPAYGLAGINRITVTGDGDDVAYWNRYVAVTQMGGHGTFSEPRTGVNVTNGTDDQVSSKLPALQAYQLTLRAPAPPAGSFDAAAAARGQGLFVGKASCATCHGGSEFTDANTRLHPVSDSMAEPETPSYASRSATKLYRTSPLKGVWQHPPYFHNGSAATLEDVVNTYDARLSLGLTAQEKADLVQYLKSL